MLLVGCCCLFCVSAIFFCVLCFKAEKRKLEEVFSLFFPLSLFVKVPRRGVPLVGYPSLLLITLLVSVSYISLLLAVAFVRVLPNTMLLLFLVVFWGDVLALFFRVDKNLSFSLTPKMRHVLFGEKIVGLTLLSRVKIPLL